MSNHMDTGANRKQMRFQDAIEGMDRRKSSRIIALKEKQQEKERKLAMALEKKNSVNQEIGNKGKGKMIMEVGNDLSDLNEDVEGPTKKGSKNKELYQLISLIKSIQELGRHSQNASASATNETSLNGTPLKNILEIIIDFLQRKDPDELFAQPITPDVYKEESYCKIVKQPMDFGTMRAKLHEGMYTDLEQFKRDIFLICSNAMSANSKTSIYHEVAEDINKHAKRIFEALSAEPQHFNVQFSQNKRRPGKKPQNGQPRTPQRVSPKLAGRKNTIEIGKRDMYWPPSKTSVAEILDGNKPDIQLNENSYKYKESLLRFVEDLGPTARRVAAKKLEPLRNLQLCNDATTSQNQHENASGPQILHQPAPQIPIEPDLFDAQTLALALPFFNRTLRTPGSAAFGNRILNTNAGNANTNASSSNVLSIVHPTVVISGPQPRQEETMNLSDRSLRSQTRRGYTMYDIPGNMLTGNSLMHQHQPMPANSMSSLNPLRLSPLCQPNQGESIPSKNPSWPTILPSLATNFSNESNTSLSGLGTSYHPGNSQAILDSADLNYGTMQASHEQFMHQAAPYTPPATQGFPNMQMQGWQEPKPSSSLQVAPPQLPWDNDQQPNLDL